MYPKCGDISHDGYSNKSRTNIYRIKSYEKARPKLDVPMDSIGIDHSHYIKYFVFLSFPFFFSVVGDCTEQTRCWELGRDDVDKLTTSGPPPASTNSSFWTPAARRISGQMVDVLCICSWVAVSSSPVIPLFFRCCCCWRLLLFNYTNVASSRVGIAVISKRNKK